MTEADYTKAITAIVKAVLADKPEAATAESIKLGARFLYNIDRIASAVDGNGRPLFPVSPP